MMKNKILGVLAFASASLMISTASAAKTLAKPVLLSDKAAIQALLEEKAMAADKDLAIVYDSMCEIKTVDVGSGVFSTEIADFYVCALHYSDGDRWNGIYKVMFSMDENHSAIESIVFEATEGSY